MYLDFCYYTKKQIINTSKEGIYTMSEYTMETITTGESWACKFKVKTFVTEDGKLFDTRNINIGEPIKGAAPGEYTSVGVIVKRDTSRRLVEVVDTAEENRTWVVSWDDCWDIDTVEWKE